MSIGIGIGFSGWPFGDTNPEAFWSAVDLAESLAIDSLWLSDRVVSEALSLEPVVALSWVAARTRKMKFGTSVLALPLRNPTVLAKELATLDFLSGGTPAAGRGSGPRRRHRAPGLRRPPLRAGPAAPRKWSTCYGRCGPGTESALKESITSSRTSPSLPSRPRPPLPSGSGEEAVPPSAAPPASPMVGWAPR